MSEEIKCPISGKSMNFAFSETILSKYKIKYYFCEESGLLKTETPYWLDEAYQEAINDTDTGLASRNIANSNLLELILECLSISNGKFLDLAGGYGLLTRLMRDKGFDCYSTDKYCQNILAKTFEPSADFKADALFAFEVLEHLEDPLQFFDEMFNRYECKTIIFSTLTFVNEVPSSDWWYYLFEGGQHITFYQPRTLSLLAERFGCEYYMINPVFHIITNKKISDISKLMLFNKFLSKLYSMNIRFKRRGLSKTWSDHLLLKEHIKTIH